jgi:tRNA (guanosine-2'-O-)-methyltransferase
MLTPFLSEERRDRIEAVLLGRTRTVVPVVDGVHDMGNVSAVMRTAEALGYQSVHVVETAERFKQSSRTAQGADKWLDVHRWPSPADCVEYLRQRGFRLVVTHLDADTPLDAIDFTLPTALVFGNEASGVSEEMLSLADVRCVIPMGGFVESFNISVAAAVALYHAHRQRVDRLGAHGDLRDAEMNMLRAQWYMKSVKEPEAILSRIADR